MHAAHHLLMRNTGSLAAAESSQKFEAALKSTVLQTFKLGHTAA